MSNWVDQIEWDDLIDEIRFEKCVLIVGPDLISFENQQTLFQVLSQQLKADDKFKDHLDVGPQYVFEHEELLQLNPGKKDTSLYRFFREFYQSRTEFDEPFAKIARLPFHLIISLLPDTRLSTAFDNIDRDHQFGYYVPTDRLLDVKPPTQKNPLIYNIIGTLDPPESVITFDHLFNYLQGILGARPLPVQLAKALKEATSFLFLGVHFEKWYMQMLLRVFIPRDSTNGKISKYSIIRAEQANDVSTFIARRLELDFLPVEPMDFLNELYRRFQEKNYLIKTPPKATAFISYSHADSQVVNPVLSVFGQENIAVVRDEESMPVGEKIRLFMQRVQEVDAVVVIVSERSLRSPWVGKEILYSIEKNIKLIPCYLDKRFLETGIAGEIGEIVKAKIREINIEINNRQEDNPLDPVSDLSEEKEIWRQFGITIPKLIEEIQGRKCISLMPPDTDTGIQQLVNTLLS